MWCLPIYLPNPYAVQIFLYLSTSELMSINCTLFLLFCLLFLVTYYAFTLMYSPGASRWSKALKPEEQSKRSLWWKSKPEVIEMASSEPSLLERATLAPSISCPREHRTMVFLSTYYLLPSIFGFVALQSLSWVTCDYNFQFEHYGFATETASYESVCAGLHSGS